MKRFQHTMTGIAPALALVGSVGLSACDDETGGIGVRPELTFSTTEVDFGEVQITTASDPKTVLVRNTGDVAINLEGIVPGNPFDADAFSFDFTTTNLPPNGTTTVQATFSPGDLGQQESVIVVRYRLAGEPTETTITLRGEGVTSQLEATPERLRFGNVLVGTTKTLPLEIANNSQFRAEIDFLARTNMAVCGSGDPAVFCIQPVDRNFREDEAFVLGSGESVSLQIEFRPPFANTQERGTFTLSYCDQTACEIDVSMDGFSVEKGFQCEPQTLDFGAVNPGASRQLVVTCRNIANEQITVNGAELTAATSDDFSIEEVPRGSVLAPAGADTPGGEVQIEINYAPTELGEDDGRLVVLVDDPDPRRAETFVSLRGSGGGPDIDVAPAQINFGLTSLLAPAKRQVVITNTGFEELQIDDIQVDTEGTGAFSSEDSGADIIPPGESRIIDVEFQPNAEGPVETKMTIFSNDQDEAQRDVLLAGEGINLPPCDFETSQDTLNFGVVEVNRSARRAFEIRNLSPTSECLVTSVTLAADSDPEYSLPEGEVTSTLIPAGAALAVSVEYVPESVGQHEGTIDFSISNPQTPFNQLPITGRGADSTLLIVPNDLFFGTIEVGCNARAKPVTIYNTGATAATIDSISLDSQDGVFEIRDAPTTPLTISPGGSIGFEVGFFAPEVSDYAGAIELNGTFNNQPVTYIISLQGSGALDAVQIDRFEQLGRPEVDILFVIDNSCSMSDEQTNLATNFTSFIQFAEAQSLDYHIGVTTTDMNDERGRLVPLPGDGPAANRVVTPQTQPSPVQVFAQNAQQGSTGSGIEFVLDAAYEALVPPNITGHNAGFLRREAVLSIVAVTDEREQSARSTQFFLNFFLSIKGFRNTQLFSFSTIDGGETSVCSTAIQPAPELHELAQRTGGVEASICTPDWSRTLEELSEQAFGFRSRFFLTNQPVIQTIEVFVEGERLPQTGDSGRQNWSYDFGTNSVNFAPLTVPNPNEVIRVEYTAECL